MSLKYFKEKFDQKVFYTCFGTTTGNFKHVLTQNFVSGLVIKKQKKIKKIHSRGHMNYISVSKTVSSLNILLNQGHM